MPLSSGFSVPAPKFVAPPAPVAINVGESVEKPNLSAKDLALYVGVPVATLCVAGGLYYYYSKSSKDDEEKSSEEDKNKTPGDAEPTKSEIVDGGVIEKPVEVDVEKV